MPNDKSMPTNGVDCTATKSILELDDVAWGELLALLERPVVHRPRLARLLAEPSIFVRQTGP